MKPQKKAIVAKKATKMPTVAKKRRTILEKNSTDVRKEKKSKKQDKIEEPKKKTEGERKKLEKTEEKKKCEDKKKAEEKKKEKPEKMEEKKRIGKDQDKKLDKVEEKKGDVPADKVDTEDCSISEGLDKKKTLKLDEKLKFEKLLIDSKKKVEKAEEKKKNGKIDEENSEEAAKQQGTVSEKNGSEEKEICGSGNAKKKGKDEKKKEVKIVKSDGKEGSKTLAVKEKKADRKKEKSDKETNQKPSAAKTKKESKSKQSPKKNVTKKTVLAKKPNFPVVKKLVEKKIKLIKPIKEEGSLTSEEEEGGKKKKKSCTVNKGKVMQEKKPKLAKQMKAKISPKHTKVTAVLTKNDKLKTLAQKIIVKKKVELKDVEKPLNEGKKVINKDESYNGTELSTIKSEVTDEKELEKNKEETTMLKAQEIKKPMKCAPKIGKKVVKKTGKTVKSQAESNNQKPPVLEDVSPEEGREQSKVCEDTIKTVVTSKDEQTGDESVIELNLKVETMNGESTGSASSTSDSEYEANEDCRKSKHREAKRKERGSSPSEERARRMRLFGFWSGPKRHRVASLNALAKVHCLYENETGGVYLGGFCKPKPEKEKPKKSKEEKEEQPRKEKEKKVETKTEESVPKRKLRNVPGLRGKHWDMMESSSSPSSSDEESEREKNVERGKKKVTKRRRRNEEVMDLKDMVVCKRMASLNATAILAASYSDEKNRRGSETSSSESSSESEVEIIKRRKQTDSDLDRKKLRQGSDPEEVIKPSKKVVIVNQDTDVTITGVYVNQTRSTHHEGFCSIAGMQYRISSTSHTQTAATAVATELHDQKTEQPCKSYTPLGALSSMQPPGSQGNHPNMSPRRHSAFSAPHQHGYYQPAGPLIQHPPTLPPVKGPPPEPTPTPPQNSEGSDDLVATSTTSGGTSNTAGGGFYRAYCPQYYGTPPQYQDLCYPPTYSHPHPHPPPYYKYAPAYRRQYYGYQESGGGGGPAGGGGTAGAPPPGVGVGVGVVDYQPPPPPPPGEYPLPYYPGYPPPPPPPAPNPAYLHSQGRPFVDHAAFQGCPCPMQSCPKNVDTGPLIGNGKGAPVVSGPGLSLPPSALVGPPSPARGLAGLAPPHGANAWDTDRVQLNTHRNLDQNQSSVQPASRNLVGGHNRPQSHRTDCRSKDEKKCSTEKKLRKCGSQKHACTSASCEVKMETLSPGEKLAPVTNCASKFHGFKLENNNVKCESCSVEIGDNITNCAANCNVKCESDFKCDIIKCEQCMKEGQMAILEIDKDSGILLIDDKLEADTDVKEELTDVVPIDAENWKKPDYEPTVQETVIEEIASVEEERPKCQKLTKRKLSLDSLSDSRKKRKVGKRTLSVGSSQDLTMINEQSTNIEESPTSRVDEPINLQEPCVTKKKQQQQPQHGKKDNSHGQKRKLENSSNPCETAPKKVKNCKSTLNGIANCLKPAASETSIMETIDDVIQQSLQMTTTTTTTTKKKDRKTKSSEKPESKKKEKKSANLLTAAIKKVSKKVNLAKDLASDKLAKIVAKNGQAKGKTESKTKAKTQEGKAKSKVKCKSQDLKVVEVKPKVQEAKPKEVAKKLEVVAQKAKVTIEPVEDSKSKKKRKNAKKMLMKKPVGCKPEDSILTNEGLTLPRKSFLKPKWSNGWSWEGDPFEAKVYLTNEESAIRRCYASMKHESGDVLRPRDCVLLKSGPRKADLPFVAKIAALWENPDDGEMMFSLLWYYRPEHTEQGRTQYDTEDEVFASRHRDANSVACIEDKCYILTFNEYCRYRKNLRRIEEGLESPGLIVPPGDQVYPRECRQPPIPVSSDMVLFCRRVYDYRGKKLVKNPG